jgi:hypothetical protein
MLDGFLFPTIAHDTKDVVLDVQMSSPQNRFGVQPVN